MKDNLITLGSLFDGIGAVPYAASFFGIKTLWASEILPNAVSVTRRHFPDMEHLGDITKLGGSKLPPVHILAFGSPCQSFSVAGDRTSFDGKSGLFFEAIRIIREMRYATNGKCPEIVLFENVPGLLNVDSRRSYKAVLEAFCEAEIPMPGSGRWANAGMVRGRGADLAWVIKDSQYYRTAQRRRRLFLVVDFGGQRAGEILFVSQSLSGYFAARESAGQGTPADAENGIGGAGRAMMPPVGVFMAGQAKNARSIAYSETVSPTLKGSPSGLNQIPCVCGPSQPQEAVAYAICSHSSNSMKSDNPHSGIYVSETSRTLDRQCGNPACNQGGVAIVEARPVCAQESSAYGFDLQQITSKTNRSSLKEIQPALCRAGNPHVVIAKTDHGGMALHGQGGDSIPIEKENLSPTLRCQAHGGLPIVPYGLQNGVPRGHAGCAEYTVRRLTPTEAERLMALPDGWTQYGHGGKPMSDSARYQMCGNSIVVNCLAYIMQNIAGLMPHANT